MALLFMSPSYSTENYFNFETQNIEIKEDGNLINAYFGKAVDKDGNFEISADNFQYIKDTGILKINGNGFILDKKKKIKIKFDKGIIRQKEFIFEAFGKTLVDDQNISLKIKTEKLYLDYKNNILFSNTKSIIRDNFYP